MKVIFKYLEVSIKYMVDYKNQAHYIFPAAQETIWINIYLN